MTERTWSVAAIDLRAGTLGLAPLPGRAGDLPGDLARLRDWGPDLVLSMTQADEMARHGAAGLPAALAAAGIGWVGFPVPDFGTPDCRTPDCGTASGATGWLAVSARATAVLTGGGRVLLHCMGGCGRSGMVALRLMVEAGEAPDAALARLRHARPCAVETDAQLAWAVAPCGS